MYTSSTTTSSSSTSGGGNRRPRHPPAQHTFQQHPNPQNYPAPQFDEPLNFRRLGGVNNEVMFESMLDGFDRRAPHFREFGEPRQRQGHQSRRTAETTFGSQPEEMISQRRMVSDDGFGRRIDMEPRFGRMAQLEPFGAPYAFGGTTMMEPQYGHGGSSGTGEVVDTETEFVVRLPTVGYAAEELNVEVTDDVLTISGNHESKGADGNTSQKQFKRSYKLAPDLDMDLMESQLSPDGAELVVRAPRRQPAIVQAPEPQKPTPIKVHFGGGSQKDGAQMPQPIHKPEPMQSQMSEPAPKPQQVMRKEEQLHPSVNGMPEIEVCEYD